MARVVKEDEQINADYYFFSLPFLMRKKIVMFYEKNTQTNDLNFKK